MSISLHFGSHNDLFRNLDKIPEEVKRKRERRRRRRQEKNGEVLLSNRISIDYSEDGTDREFAHVRDPHAEMTLAEIEEAADDRYSHTLYSISIKLICAVCIHDAAA